MMNEYNSQQMKCRLITLAVILLHCSFTESETQCAIQKFYQSHSEWLDSRGQLNFSDINLPDNCQPCETAERLAKVIESSLVCYETNSGESPIGDLCDWYPYRQIRDISRKFPSIAGLKVLSLTKYKILNWINIDETFDELTDLESLFLESNHITGWNVSGTPPNLISLRVLSLANNPIEVLSKESFLWLENSSLEYLNLRGCSGLKILDNLVFTPLKNKKFWLDLSYTIIESKELANLTAGLRTTEWNKGLQALSLAHTGLTKVPTDALTNVAHSLQKLSLQGNYFSNCWSTLFESNGGDCTLPNMINLEEINLRDSSVSEFPCHILFNSTPKLEKLYLDENPLSRMSCSANATISYLSLQSLNDRAGFQLCNNGSNCSFPTLKTLDLSHSKVSSLNFKDLTNLRVLSLCNTESDTIDNILEPLTNLRVLDLGYNNLSNSLENQVFKGLSKLKELHLQSSSIESISPSSFQDLENLKVLDMSQNFLRKLDGINLQNSKLKKIILKENRILPWKTPLFGNKHKIEILDLQGNWVSDITNAMEADFKQVDSLDISSNPLSCESCNVGYFFETYQKKEETLFDETHEFFNFTLINWDKQIAYMCMTKDNEQNPLNETHIFEFCRTPSTTEPISTTIENTENENKAEKQEIDGGLIFIYVLSALIACTLIGSAICYWKHWNIRTCAKVFKSSLKLNILKDNEKKLSKTKHYQYDVFLSYSDKDREWILEQLIPNIEQQNNIKVCLHERDFQAGLPVLENIITCMDNSRCVLMVLSEAFLRSHWCQFELNLAQHRLLELQHDRLILVLLENIPRDKCSKMLRYLMLTKTYLLWPEKDREEDKRLFWRQLKKAIGPIPETVNVSFA